jgi:hypothetical protein
MVQLIKIDRLGPRIEGMLYKLSFDENWALLDKVILLVLIVGHLLRLIFRGPERFLKLDAIFSVLSNSSNCFQCVDFLS